jgi:hypothetical protein
MMEYYRQKIFVHVEILLKKYADCCLPRNGIYKKHIDIWFPFPLNVEPI